MKSVETYSIEKDVVEKLKRYSQALSCSKSELVETALIDYFEKGRVGSHEEEAYRKKLVRLQVLELELLAAMKGSRSISLQECGSRCDNE